ncbi:MAG: nucleoside-diphosphate kinase [Erysipelotrichaceae bacterium]|nr:nucleoside-diphosphate kinase [Erysipelotrichaceae bacterium]MDP3305548.1 nucleoside-diphosphate kinase [Erysipelotrichaceae bacterium]
MASRTFIMLKPDAIEKNLEGDILAFFKDYGIEVVRWDTVIVDEPLIINHYQEVIDKLNMPDFPNRIRTYFVGKTVRIFEMESKENNIVAKVRELVGATDPSKAGSDTIRGKYSDDSMDLAKEQQRLVHNLIHASDSDENAQKEIDLWFDR